jgi:Putative Flp pilus-assembly TadE/G-like
MTEHRRVRRVARRRSHGQAVVVLALGAIALMATVGLAVDGGAEVGNYRDAQNAADAGALAAARLIFLGGIASPPTAPTTTQLTTASDSAITHNGAVPGKADLSATLTTTGGLQDNFVPDTGTGVTAHAALTSITAGLNALLASVSASVTATEATASSLVKPIASGGSSGSGQVDLAGINVTVTALGLPVSVSGFLQCLQSLLSYPTAQSANLLGVWSGSASCTTANLLGLVSSLLGTLGSITASAGINLSPESTNTFISNVAPYLTRTVSSVSTTTANILNLGTTLTASAANIVSQTGQSANVIASNDFNLANVVTGLLGLGVNIPLVTIHNELDYSPSTGVTAPTPTCDTGSITIAGSTYSILPNCHIPLLPINLLGVSLQDITTDVTTSGCPGLSCSEHGCFLQLSVLASLANVCVGEFDLSASGHKMSASAAAGNTPLTNAVTVTAHKPTPTYFTHVLGWNGTNPTAQTTAGVYQVADESDAAFANAPYAVPSVATNMDCPCAATPLTVGHQYYLYGSSMQTYSPVDKFAATWQGQVAAGSTGHGTGDTLTAVAGAGSGPGAYTTGGSYYLLPVIDPASAVVEYFAVFQPVAGHPNWGQLVNNIPVQAVPSTTWTNTTPAAAVTIKVSG